MASKFLLRLYIAGATVRSKQCIANLEALCTWELRGEYKLEVIDVLARPELADDDKIVATPTLIKKLPPPVRRLIGDLSEREKLLVGLDLRQL